MKSDEKFGLSFDFVKKPKNWIPARAEGERKISAILFSMWFYTLINTSR